MNTAAPAQETQRKGDWMMTASGRKFWPLDPREDEVSIHDIARALSNQVRFGGHQPTGKAYTVAQHSVVVAKLARQLTHLPTDTIKWALLHDASEAYCVDVPRPLKRFLEGYAAIESGVMAAIAMRFGLGGIVVPDLVHELDNVALASEALWLFGPEAIADWNLSHTPRLGLIDDCWSHEEAEKRFLDEFSRITFEELYGRQ